VGSKKARRAFVDGSCGGFLVLAIGMDIIQGVHDR
jgi:hypothetical protein